MKDKDYFQKLEKAYEESIREGLDLPEERIWERAKERVEFRELVERASEKSRLEGLAYGDIVMEMMDELEARKIN